MPDRLTAVYRLRCDAAAIEQRAAALAVEQSVEMPVSAIDDAVVLAEVVGRVESIVDLGADRGDGRFEVRVGLAVATTGLEAGQLLNMLFGNSSIHDDVTLHDAVLPPALVAAFAGPNHGLAGWRAPLGAAARALTGSALKPQGLPVAALAALAGRLARGGLDLIKDDHGLADQAYSRFADRVAAVAEAVAAANAASGGHTRYLPSVSGDLDQLRRQIALARAAGLDGVLIAPMIVGVPAFYAVVRAFPDMAFMVHPALAGASRLAPPLLLGTLFRLFGADATVFPNHGGRFGYRPETCRDLARAAHRPWGAVKPTLPVPAGGMTLDRVPEMLRFYGPDVLLLIGGNLLAAGAALTRQTAAFTELVHRYDR